MKFKIFQSTFENTFKSQWFDWISSTFVNSVEQYRSADTLLPLKPILKAPKFVMAVLNFGINFSYEESLIFTNLDNEQMG